MSPQASPVQTRPRVEGVREAEILAATMEVLADVGYDRLTMDAVAQRAKASKATLYRRWNGKVSLVIDALHHHHQHDSPPVIVDTGSLRGDLIESFCGHGGLTTRGRAGRVLNRRPFDREDRARRAGRRPGS